MFFQWFLIWVHCFWLDWAVSPNVIAAWWEVLKGQQKQQLAEVLLSACCSHFCIESAQCFDMTIAEPHLAFGFPALSRSQADGQAARWSLGAPLDLRLKGQVCMPLLPHGQFMGWSQLLKERTVPARHAENFTSEVMKKELSNLFSPH